VAAERTGSPPRPETTPRPAPRGFFALVQLYMAVVVFVGFAPSFYLRPERALEMPAVIHVHAGVMTLWILFMALQGVLPARGRIDLHQRLGWCGAGLAALVMITGVMIAVRGVHDGWDPFGLGSPEAIIKTFVMKSGCFGLVDRGKGLASRNIERALADQGELQDKSNIGRKQVKAADYFIVPDLVTRNNDSGGGGVGGFLGGMLGGTVGGLVGGINIKKKEANVTLTLVNSRTTEQERLTEGFACKKDIGFGGGLGLGGFGGAGGIGGTSYENTEIGQVIVLAYLDAYTNLVRDLGGLPENASAAAPVAR
jgi:curli biogenesis system outer membrane secretion channel CsgG